MDIRKTRLFAYLVVLILLLGQLPVMPVRAIGTDDPILANDEGRIIKTAEPVEGEVNKWKITVRAEYKAKPKPTDLLISLDRSGSMKYGERLADGSVEMQNVPVERQRMTVAKQAISKLADVALAENPDNLMALQSWSYGYNYGTQVFSNSLTEHNDFTHDANAIKGSLDQVPVGGGTFTQKALRMGDIAMGRAKQADTDNKKQRAIVLITDGRPTVGYKVDRNKISNDAWANMWTWQTGITSTGDTTTGNSIQNASDGVIRTTDATKPIYVGGVTIWSALLQARWRVRERERTHRLTLLYLMIMFRLEHSIMPIPATAISSTASAGVLICPTRSKALTGTVIIITGIFVRIPSLKQIK